MQSSDAGAGLLDLELLLGEQQEHRVDEDVGLLIASTAGRLPASGVAPTVQEPTSPLSVRDSVGQADVERRGTELRGRREERVAVVEALVALREDRHHLAFVHAAQLQLLDAKLGERGAAQAHLEGPSCRGFRYAGIRYFAWPVKRVFALTEADFAPRLGRLTATIFSI